MRTGDTEADKILDRLLAVPDADLKNVLSTAKEYMDHPSFKGVLGIPAGKRLLMQIKLALGEYEHKERT